MTSVRLLLGLALVLAACSSEPPSENSSEGIVVEVDGDLATVDSFTISTGPDGRMTFVPDPDGDFAFPLPHLQDHLRSGDPVVVWWEDRDGVLWAVGVDDAGDSAH